MMLDIIQDFLEYMEWTTYERLDGSVCGIERQKSIDRFNTEEDSNIFLLSTRAGGYGLNLIAATFVIFIDSDYNPYRDI